MNYLLTLIKTKKIYLFLVFVIFLSFTTEAQYKENSEIGFIGGVSYYLGDLNTTHFSQSSIAGGLTLRKNIDIDGSKIKKPTKVELKERSWRADPSDGFRPLKYVRKKYLRKNKI